ncbi:PepSY domain-containing protein [Virgibacillus necropolis]|uniref:PepSY domain-containing protein n=1 Tax=Virgibacillus necropolis TaxID=163877 RepID=UPI0038514125
MSKKKKVTIGAIIVTVILGVGIFQSTASQAEATLSTDDIRKLVADQYPGTITELELDEEKNNAVYEVEILGKKKEYDLKLDGNTGEVLHLSEKPLSKQAKNNYDNEADDDKDDKKVEKQQADDKNSTKKAVIEANKAEKIALKEFDGKITSIELDEDDGRLTYEIEIHNAKKEADIEIDAYTGEVMVVSIEQDDNDDDGEDDNDDKNED